MLKRRLGKHCSSAIPISPGSEYPLDSNWSSFETVDASKDFAHPSGSKGCDDFIEAESRAGGQRHGSEPILVVKPDGQKENEE